MSERRITTVFRYFCLAMAVLAICAFGEKAYAQDYIVVDASDSILQAGGWNQPAPSDDGLQAQSAYDLQGIYAAFESAIDSWDYASESVAVNVSEFGIAQDDCQSIYSGFRNSHGRYFYLSSKLGLRISNSLVTEFVIYFDTSYTREHIVDFEKTAHAIAAKVDAGWNDEQKALFLHDYLCTHCQYDTSYKNYNAYNALIEGCAVCQGYATAYGYLLSLVGVESDVVSSEEMNHAWNLVKVDGWQYYVDCTWDDPSNLKIPSYAGHSNFLRSLAGITETGHTSSDWVDTAGNDIHAANVAATSTKYEPYYWKDCNTLIPHVGNVWAYTTENGIAAHDYATGNDKVLIAETGHWWVVGKEESAYHPGNYASLSATSDAFIVAEATLVYTVTPNGAKSEPAAYTLSAEERAKGYLYSLLYNEQTGLYECAYYASKTSDPAGSFTLDLSVHVESVSISPKTVKAPWGTTVRLNATISPANAFNQAIEWTSSNEEVATVNDEGQVDLLSVGSATITATSIDGGKADSAAITVEPLTLEPEQVTLIGADDLTYTGSAQEPGFEVAANGNTLAEGTDYTVTWENNKNAGTAKAIFTGTGCYTGTVEKEFAIKPVNLSDCTVEIADAAFDGTEKEPAIHILHDGNEIPATDYELAYRNNINAGQEAVVAVKPKTENFVGTADFAFHIEPLNLETAEDLNVSGIYDRVYTGSELTLDLAVSIGETQLTPETDYAVSYDNNTEIGDATITITGMGNYAGTINRTFRIQEASMDIAEIEVAEAVYTGADIQPEVTVRVDGKVLDPADYDVEYANNRNAGKGMVTVTGKKNIKGSANKEFKINPAKFEDIQIDDIAPVEYSGREQRPAITVKLGDVTLPESDYEEGYSDNINVTEAARFTIGPKGGNLEGTPREGTFKISPKSIADAQVALDSAEFLFDGKAHEPAVAVSLEGFGELAATDYDIAYDGDASVGDNHRVTVTGKGNFTGTATSKYSIVKSKTTQVDGIAFTYELDNAGEALITAIDANGASQIIIPAKIDDLSIGGIAESALESIPAGTNVDAAEGSGASGAVSAYNQTAAERAISAITAKLETLPNFDSPEDLDDSNKQILADAQAIYDGLSPNQKSLASSALNAIAQANEKLESLEKQVADQKAADSVIAQINALPESIGNAQDAAAVQAARAAYNALSEEQQALVAAAGKYATLEAAENSSEAYAKSLEVTVGKVVSAGSGASAAQYKITSASEVQYLKSSLPTSAKSANIPATVQISGKTFAVTSIGPNALAKYAKLTKVTGGANITEIGASAFAGCKALKSFTVGAKVTKIGAKAFQNCKKLKKVTVKSKVLKSVGKKAFKGTAAKIAVKVPKAKKAAYKKLLKKAGLPKKGKVK